MTNENLSSIQEVMGPEPAEHDYAVMLPCTPDAFGEFISGLLGKPQVIEGYVDGYFELCREDIFNIYHVINQRISQQNEARLIQFSALISYDDNSTVLLNSLQDFMTYAEVRSHISTGFQLSWTYLVKFIDKQVHEKQTIDISYRSGHRSRNAFRSETLSTERKDVYLGFYFRICHTARSWGVDIESLIAGHLGTLKRANISSRLLFVSENIGFISFFACALLFLVSNAGLFYAIKMYSELQTRQFSEQIAGFSGVDKYNEAVMYLANHSISGSIASYMVSILVYMIITLVFIIFFGIALSESLRYYPTGALLLTTQSETAYDLQQRSISKSWLDSSITTVVGLAIGVGSNFLFLWLTTHWM